MVQSTIIITDGENSIVSRKEPIPANTSDTLTRVATAPELTRWQRWILTGARIVTVIVAWVFFTCVIGNKWRPLYQTLGIAALTYHWIMYWRTFGKMKMKQEFLLDVLVDNDIVGDDDYIKWYLRGIRDETATPLLTCYTAWSALIAIRHIPNGIALPQPLATAYLVAMAVSLSLACFGRSWAIKKFQKLQ